MLVRVIRKMRDSIPEGWLVFIDSIRCKIHFGFRVIEISLIAGTENRVRRHRDLISDGELVASLQQIENIGQMALATSMSVYCFGAETTCRGKTMSKIASEILRNIEHLFAGHTGWEYI